MRYNDGLLALSTILLCLLSTAPSLILAVPSVANQRPAAPFQIPLVSQQASTGGRPWVRVRDHIIRFIWRIPERQQDRRCSGKADISRSPSGPKQSARYGDDVVLRFKIGSAEEASALAEASNVLFLDIWEFTKDWVDVRLAKEVVRVPRIIRAGLRLTVSLLGSVIAWIATIFSASRSHPFNA